MANRDDHHEEAEHHDGEGDDHHGELPAFAFSARDTTQLVGAYVQDRFNPAHKSLG